MRVHACALIFLGLLTAFFCPSGYAQTSFSGTVLGTVTDPSGAVITGARVAVTNTEANVKATVQSDQFGNYYVPNLRPGPYAVEFEFKGFQRARRERVVLQINQQIRIDLTSLDSKPLSQSGRMLLTAGSRVVNTGMKWNADHTALADWGGPPTLIEPVTGRITLRNLEAAKAVSVAALDGAGRRMPEALPVKLTSQGWQITVGAAATTWYEISVKR
jgi:hypothetical protein